MTKAPTFNNNAGNFNQVTGGYVQATLLPDAGKSQVPGITHTPLEGPASQLRMARKDGSYDVYNPTKTADFDEKESITVIGPKDNIITFTGDKSDQTAHFTYQD